MGQALNFPAACCGNSCNARGESKLEREQELHPSVTVDSIVLSEEATDDMVLALVEMQEAVRFHRMALHSEASQHLSLAEQHLKLCAGNSGVFQLRHAMDSDPEITTVRAARAAVENVLSTWHKTPVFQRQNSLTRASKMVMPGQPESVHQAAAAWVEEDNRTRTISTGESQNGNGIEVARKPTASGDMSSKPLPVLTKSNSTLMEVVQQAELESRVKSGPSGEPVDEDPLSPSNIVQDPMQSLEDGLQKVFELCRCTQVLKAHQALEHLELDVAATFQLCQAARRELEDSVRAFTLRLHSDKTILKLKSVHARFQESVPLMVPPAQDDSRWARISITDDKMDKDFGMEVCLRHAEKSEREASGPSTQLIGIVFIDNYPLSLARSVSGDFEPDLFKSEWIKDCKTFSAQMGNASQFFSKICYMHLSPALLPIQLEEVVLKEWAVCPEEIVAGRGPGVLMLETTPPDQTDWEGWKLPPHSRGVTRLAGGLKIHYKSLGTTPGKTNIMSVAKIGVPVPSWMLPLTLVKRFIGDLFKETLFRLKEGMVDHWHELDYDKRIDSNAPFYGPINQMQH